MTVVQGQHDNIEEKPADAQRTSKLMTLPPDVLNLLNILISANRFCCPPDRERHNDEKCINDNPPLARSSIGGSVGP